ncbi:bifunctional UDP-N-acetylglucosamine diphosphorylase/glucosamine-1-phosphate N-acetyltransferase GlmU [Lichenifustis flavocetrariae]|uniref:Bifunctional protein GlmU n=1 Tax=Lichenifustis flavocetrariae TaxID=2949735 RepID=A0AA41YZV5_9HYPH|nr:bifunctional UDP-N-acetylglucosamine diphosphorylase/glucosamine-1-phosphate N-acetyltransferase GlmU [Lichenifustis flavocetrariae]MCW6511624.1 bifunctional UDP-N-acetylglucosamine diphosphorylase/glucosamine-1-phosphate N-acetyltransferase GlmU [Lichenifustis flavocetrariae]
MTDLPSRRCLAVVLAAGEGTRMRSAIPKVLHAVAGRSMLGHVLAAVADVGVDGVAVVIGPGRHDVAQAAVKACPTARIFVQAERRGTAHAVLAARDALDEGYDDVLVLYADVPLIEADTLRRMRSALAEGAAVVALGFEAADPTGYGRLITQEGALTAIREHKDANAAERAVTLCNSGLMAIDGRKALDLLGRVRPHNAQGEFYLTDAVEIACADGERCAAPIASEAEVMGVNDRVQLAAAEAVAQIRLREAAMRAGVTMQAPDTVHLSFDTRLGRDIVIEPHVVIGPGVAVADGAVLHSFSHLEGATVAAGANVGPYARLRPGAKLAAGAKVGNFVEIKNADVGEGAKISHLSYIGDASVGAGANIGAGTITCNYDGFNKAHTAIGAGAFIGSNSALVAPVTIGAGAFVGSGSVITDDVPADALALARGRQFVKEGWAKDFRAARAKPK